MNLNMIHHFKIRVICITVNYSFDLILPQYKAVRLINKIINNHRYKIKSEVNKLYKGNKYKMQMCFEHSLNTPIKVEFIHI